MRPTPFVLVFAFALGASAAPAPEPAASATTPAALEKEARDVILELVACGTRHSLSSWTDPKRGIGCARDRIVARFQAISKATGGKLRVVVDKYETKSARTKDALVPMENVYAILDGTDAALKTRVAAMSGHYDSMPSDIMDPVTDAPGADDDASGVAATILASRLLSGAPEGFRSTLIFAALAGEEQGLLGARRFKEWLAQQGYTVSGYVTNDIVGSTNGADDKRIRVFSEGGPDGVDHPSRDLARFVEDAVGKEKVRLVFRRDRLGRGGDHIPFVEGGLPAIRFTEPKEDYRHQHQTPREEGGVEFGDTPDHVEFGFVAAVSTVNASVLAALASAPAPPKSVTLTGAVSPAVRIGIEADADPLRQGFVVLRRETTVHRFTPLRLVESPGEVLLDGMSTDNDFFAVAAVGKNGARSVAVPATAVVRRPPGYVPGSMPAPTPAPASAPAPAPK